MVTLEEKFYEEFTLDMADYTVEVIGTDGQFLDIILWKAQGGIGGPGLSSGDPLVIDVGDRVRIYNNFIDDDTGNSNWDGSVDIISWETGYWDTTTSLTIPAGSTSSYRTVQSAAGGNTDSIRAIDTAGANPSNANDDFFFSFNAASITAPVVNNLQSFATTANSNTSCDVSLSSSGSGGTLEYNKSTSTTVPTSGWQSSNTVTGLTRGTAYYLWARRGVGYEDRTNAALTPPYLTPDLGISLSEGSELTIGALDTQFTLTVADGNANDEYQVRDSASTQHESRIGDGGIIVTDTPAGNSETYTIFGRRPQGTGGDDNYTTTGTSISVLQESSSGIVPPAILSVTDDNANAASVTATVNLSSNGSGGTLQYAQTPTNSVPASGWQGGNTFSHPRNTTKYYWASQSTNTAGAYDSLTKIVGNYTASEYGIQIRNASGTLTLDTTDRVTGIVSRGSVSVTTGTTNVGTASVPQYEGTSGTVSFVGMTPSNSEEFEVWISGNVPTAQFGLTNFSINRGTGSYTVTYRSYTASQAITVPYFNVRY